MKEIPQDLPYEKAFAQLETIVRELEKGNVPLEETIEKFSQGMNLYQFCLTKVLEGEMEIKKIIQKYGDKLSLAEMDAGAGDNVPEDEEDTRGEREL